MSERPVGFGVVGCGVVADYHINAIAAIEGARLVAVCDAVEARAREVGEERDVQWYTSHEEMVQSPAIDVICICTPSGLRIPIAADAAAAGKHLVIEKPIDISLDRADRIIAAAQAAGVQLMCIFQLRFGDAVQRLRQAVQSGRLGKLALGDAYIKWYRPQLKPMLLALLRSIEPSLYDGLGTIFPSSHCSISVRYPIESLQIRVSSLVL